MHRRQRREVTCQQISLNLLFGRKADDLCKHISSAEQKRQRQAPALSLSLTRISREASVNVVVSMENQDSPCSSVV